MNADPTLHLHSDQNAPPSRPSVDTRELFARFPHLQKIVDLWGTAACRAYLMGLITDTRDGRRQGFPANHARTLFQLLHEHDERFPQFDHGREERQWVDVRPRRGGVDGE